MRVLLTGKNGQLGFELQRTLATLGELTALNHQQCDLSKPDQLRTLIRAIRPQIIVNAAAYTAVDRAESEAEQAMSVNAVAPGILAEEAEKLGALLVHYSSDYVFDGQKTTPYKEDDIPNPQSVYGISKWMGERALQAQRGRHLILRSGWVFGTHGENFAKTMLRLATERDTLSVIDKQFGTPTSAGLIADVTALLLRDAMRMPENFPYGLYHLSASGVTNWHAYAVHVIEHARAAGEKIRVAPHNIRAIQDAHYSSAAKRPNYSQLDTQRLQQTFGIHLPDWVSGVNHVLQQIVRP
jgi:dTDP-4-dehydrorhamnose reductase